MASSLNERELILLLAELHRLTEKHHHTGLSRLAAEVGKELKQKQCPHLSTKTETTSSPHGPYEVCTCQDCGYVDIKKLYEYGS